MAPARAGRWWMTGDGSVGYGPGKGTAEPQDWGPPAYAKVLSTKVVS